MSGKELQRNVGRPLVPLPAVRELAADFVGRATVAELDVDANPLMPDRYDVRQLPTVLIFSNGEVDNRFTGYQTRDQLAQALDAEIGSPSTNDGLRTAN